MKNYLLFLSCFILLGISLTPRQTQAQCIVDPSYNTPGVFPDTLRDGCLYTQYFDTVQFVFPTDTTVFGFTVNFDSFQVGSLMIPTNLDWIQFECDSPDPNCTYVTNPPNLARGCARLWGCPDKSTQPGGDSIMIEGLAWVTVFGAPQSFPQTIYLKLEIPDSSVCSNPAGCPVAAPEINLGRDLNMHIFPNPVNARSVVGFHLEKGASVSIEVLDVFGRKLSVVQQRKMNSGDHQINLNELHGLDSGIYFVRLNLNEGGFYKTLKVSVLN